MDSRHKTQAICGIVIWFASIPVALIAGAIGHKLIPASTIPPDTISGALFLSVLAVQYIAFFWGGSHLARAKGYSNGLLVLGIFWPAQLIIFPLLLFALPDKCSRESGWP